MKFPNVAAGTKKLFTAEVLGLIGAILLVLGTLFAVVLVKTGDDVLASGSGSAAAAWLVGGFSTILFAGGGVIIAIISVVLKLVGINTARRDESDSKFFTIAFYCVVICLVLSVTMGILNAAVGNPTVTSWVKTVADLLNLFSTYYVLYGIEDFAKKSGATDLAEKARATVYIVCGAFCISIICELLLNIINIGVAFGVILILVTLAAKLAGYVLYLGVLSRSKKTFAE
ncbi:MAG: hypothetical protein J5819_07380 [Eubacterium sp.]|nr:hypothetical protein [Eubacterium sp.]